MSSMVTHYQTYVTVFYYDSTPILRAHQDPLYPDESQRCETLVAKHREISISETHPSVMLMYCEAE